MPELHYPSSDTGRLETLRNAKQRLDSVDPADVVLTPATAAKLNQSFTDWDREVRERDLAAGEQSAASTAVANAGDALRMYISHFLQAFNDAVARGEFSPAERAKFQLPASQESVPTLSNEDDLMTWGQRLITGEAARIADGLTAVTMPPIAAVEQKFQAFDAARAARDAAADQTGDETDDVVEMRDGVDDFIREDLWYEILSAYRKEEPAAGRRKARLWGVRYRFRAGETPEPGETLDAAEGDGASE